MCEEPYTGQCERYATNVRTWYLNTYVKMFCKVNPWCRTLNTICIHKNVLKLYIPIVCTL